GPARLDADRAPPRRAGKETDMATLRSLILLVGLALLLAACTAPGSQGETPGPAPGASTPAGPTTEDDAPPTVHRGPSPGAAAPAAGAAAPPTAHAGPIPGAPAPGGPAAAGAAVDRSCTTDADCTVKNVGNCCGYYPACVNVDSPTDPEGVQAQCAAEGRMGVCGFPEISGCQCVQGTCQDQRREALLE